MDLSLSEELLEVSGKIKDFVFHKVEPLEPEYHAEVGVGDRWSHTERQDEILGSLKEEARKQGLWNFFLPESQGGAGISILNMPIWLRSWGAVDLLLSRLIVVHQIQGIWKF